MRQCLFSALFLLVTSSGAEAACVDPSALVRSTVSIARNFDDHEMKVTPGVFGIRGTGWFLSPRLLVTAAHVVEAMHLSGNDWKEIELRERESKGSIPVRVLRVAGSHSEKMAVLELRASFPGAAALQLRMEPLVAEERVASLAYPRGHLRFAGGRFVRYGEETTSPGRPSSKCTTATTAWCSITVPRERPCSIAKAESWRSSARQSHRRSSFLS